MAERKVGEGEVSWSRNLRSAEPGVAGDDDHGVVDVGIREHRPLWRAGGSRGVHERHHVFGKRLGHAPLDPTGGALTVTPSHSQEILPVHEPGIVV